MKVRRHRSGNQPRLLVMAGLMLGAMLLLVGELWRLQVPRQSDYESRFMRQSIRRVRLPGVRGRVFDATGKCLADNRPSYSIAIFMEEIGQPGSWKNTAARGMELIETISERIGLPVQVTTEDLMKHIHRRLPLPFIAWEDIDALTMARWAENTSDLKGVDIYNRSERIYPRGGSFAHLLGYVGRADPSKDKQGERIHYYLPDLTGRAGLEKLYNEFLRGEAGGKLVQIDVSGFRHDDLALRKPKAGGDLQLTIDAEVQQYAIDALSTNRGAVVVLDPNNGDVLAMASAPGFDPNRIRYSSYYRRINTDANVPMIYRAVFGQYPPGSTFKPIVALAALMEKKEFAETTYTCHGVFRIGTRTMRCWIGRPGHGELGLRQALQHSCNIYMYHTGLEIGYEPIREMARNFGLGEKTGIDVGIGVEKPGWIPDSSRNDTDLCNMTIGQGRILVTPLQMAVVAATLANGGSVYKPRVVKGIRYAGDEKFQPMPTFRTRRIDFPPDALELVRGGMKDVVMHERGTAKKARVPGVVIAGKTGTAEYKKKVNGEVVTRKHTWMISFAPYDFPRYAVAFLIEDGVSGGRTVGPRLSELYKHIFKYDGTLKEGI